MLFFGYNAPARFPVIVCNPVHAVMLYFVPKLSGCLTASVPDDKIREPFSRSVNGNPNPLTVFLNRHKYAFRQLLPSLFFYFPNEAPVFLSRIS
ncbi:hypothetical protein Barb4_05094 [Bacteroidales bacterium Barb4]|nr:hypothetical protein Barb4_05094 [Bacteroidales bacterium Barb4]